ncbi:hypothetical protein [Amnibacterium kyonggiense]|uniref:Uncharacterized protein n=1 Tax=Amnibacterium kyonggiense TaxID=595671 RepID=A0A4R7FD13_9MICO|nr:hypothetical protein [Amnibacterium kyonggiense]TDS74829.1 hypothetical protein CLV52_3351 [Amnibacterium kyonggiense]
MTRSVRPLTTAAVLLAVAAVLTGCTARPGAAPVTGPNAEPAASIRFTCPSAEEVAALTATPFTSEHAGADGCEYTTAADEGTAAARIEVRHPATTAATAATARVAAIERGDTTADLRSLGFDAFTAASERDCTAWFPAVDGVLTAVTAQRPGEKGTAACDLATAVATLAGASTRQGSAPTVAVIAADRLLGGATEAESWPWRIGSSIGARVDLATGTGYLRPSRATSLAGRASRIPADSAAAVFVSGTAEGRASRLEVLRAATAALSAAAARAPRARLVVVGPVAGPSADPDEVEELQVELRSAASIAGAQYIEPPADASATATLRAVAASVGTALESAGVGKG